MDVDSVTTYRIAFDDNLLQWSHVLMDVDRTLADIADCVVDGFNGATS